MRTCCRIWKYLRLRVMGSRVYSEICCWMDTSREHTNILLILREATMLARSQKETKEAAIQRCYALLFLKVTDQTHYGSLLTEWCQA